MKTQAEKDAAELKALRDFFECWSAVGPKDIFLAKKGAIACDAFSEVRRVQQLEVSVKGDGQ